MGRDAYRPSTVSSTRTFQTPAVHPETAEEKPKKAITKLPKPPKLPAMPGVQISVPKFTLPWVIVGALVITSLFLFVQYRDAKHKLSAPQSNAATTQQANTVISKVGKLVVLPRGETPTIATVANVDKLKSQSFFTNAQNGDKVIVYNQAKEAILYRPSSNQIVTMAPVSGSGSN